MQPHIAVSENHEPGLNEKKQIADTVAGVNDPSSPSLEDASINRRSARATTFFAVAGCVSFEWSSSTAFD